VHNDIQELCRSSRLVAAPVMKYAGVQSLYWLFTWWP